MNYVVLVSLPPHKFVHLSGF